MPLLGPRQPAGYARAARRTCAWGARNDSQPRARLPSRQHLHFVSAACLRARRPATRQLPAGCMWHGGAAEPHAVRPQRGRGAAKPGTACSWRGRAAELGAVSFRRGTGAAEAGDACHAPQARSECVQAGSEHQRAERRDGWRQLCHGQRIQAHACRAQSGARSSACAVASDKPDIPLSSTR